jgi:protease-4
MKSFLKMLLASIIGGGILLFLIFLLFASIASISSPELEVKDKSIIRIDLSASFVDRAQNNPFAQFDPLSGSPESANGLTDIISALKAAQDDPKIIGIYLDGGVPLAGNATLKEVRNALLDFKSSGKFIYGYSEILTQKGLYLSSVADSFFLNPEGILEFSGLSASVTYYRKALEKLGVKPVVLRATGNKFKSAVEPYLLDEMSSSNRMQLTELLDSFWSTYLSDLAESRKISIAQLNLTADSMLTDPTAAAEIGLIDGLAYYDQIQDLLKAASNADKFSAINFISVSKYAKQLDLNGNSDYSDERIAVIIAQGEIRGGEGSEYIIGSDRIAAAIRKDERQG